MKTARDIRSGLDQSREKKVPCRTTQIEDEIKKRIAETEGALLTEDERNAIVQKEEKRIEEDRKKMDADLKEIESMWIDVENAMKRIEEERKRLR